jgi:hypothetical protein
MIFIPTKFRNIASFNSVVKQNNDSNKTCSYVSDLYCSTLHLSKGDGLWVVSINKRWHISTPLQVHICGFSQKFLLLKIIHPLKNYQHTEFHGPTLSGASFAFTSSTSAIFNGRSYWIIINGVEVTFNGMTFLLTLLKIYELFQSFLGSTHWGTDWQTSGGRQDAQNGNPFQGK